jgi:methylmalonyl-CoA/ethylmalonyl-CoA epimerase
MRSDHVIDEPPRIAYKPHGEAEMKAHDILKTTLVCQIAIVVKDAEKATRRFAELIGVDPPKVFTANADGSDVVVYRGTSTRGRVKLSFFKMQNLDLEFIEPTEDPTTWKEFLETKGQGVHHIAFKAKDRMLATAKELEKEGVPLVQYGKKYSYNDCSDELGVILELLDID